MDKKALMRWVLDLCVMVGLAWGGFLYGRIDKIQEVTRDNSYRMDSIEKSLLIVSESMQSVVESINNLADTQEALVLVYTFRADPWSGTMMQALQDDWYDIMVRISPEMKHSDMPSVKAIQSEFSSDLIPDKLRNSN